MTASADHSQDNVPPVLLDADALLCLACHEPVQHEVVTYLGDRGWVAPLVLEETARNLQVQRLNPINRFARSVALTFGAIGGFDHDAVRNRTLEIRERFMSYEYDRQHLGECESLAIGERLDAVFVTNDQEALRVGGRLGVRVADVCVLVDKVARAGYLTSAQVTAWRDACEDRGQGPPCENMTLGGT